MDLPNVVYPVLCSPKYDGIRCVIRNGIALSRKLKPIPNRYIRDILKDCPDNLDGELIIDHASFNQIQSEIMREDGTPDFKYYVFDIVSKFDYSDRVTDLAELQLPDFCVPVIPILIHNKEELLAYEEECLASGYEGVMIRSTDGPYKYGRSTVKQGFLMKLKRFQDSEATIIGFEELQNNTNHATLDERGYTKRSHKKEGMIPAGTLGAFLVEENGKTFKVSTGMTAEERQQYWDTRSDMLGKLVKYKSQEAGALNLPRFPVFLGIRHPDDLTG